LIPPRWGFERISRRIVARHGVGRDFRPRAFLNSQVGLMKSWKKRHARFSGEYKPGRRFSGHGAAFTSVVSGCVRRGRIMFGTLIHESNAFPRVALPRLMAAVGKQNAARLRGAAKLLSA